MTEYPEEKISEFMEMYTRKTPAQEEDTYYVWLDIDQQHFRIFEPTETPKQADWYRRQLAIALIRLTLKHQGDG
jgi:hypothetical protein